MRIRLLVTLTAFALCACVTALTQAGSQVRVTSNADVVSGCEFLGQVAGSSQSGVASRAERDVMNELRNMAADLGGNVVFLTTSTSGYAGRASVGEAYRCDPSAPEG